MPIDRDPPPPPGLTDRIISACDHCAAGHPPVWQRHSKEWVHRRSTQVKSGTQWSITLCQANAIRKGG